MKPLTYASFFSTPIYSIILMIIYQLWGMDYVIVTAIALFIGQTDQFFYLLKEKYGIK